MIFNFPFLLTYFLFMVSIYRVMAYEKYKPEPQHQKATFIIHAVNHFPKFALPAPPHRPPFPYTTAQRLKYNQDKFRTTYHHKPFLLPSQPIRIRQSLPLLYSLINIFDPLLTVSIPVITIFGLSRRTSHLPLLLLR